MGKVALKEWVPNSVETDDELSAGEFTDDESMRKHYEKSRVIDMELAIKKRRKSAKKAEKRMGGPPKIWFEAQLRKESLMAKKVVELAKAKITKKEAEREERELNEDKKKGKAKKEDKKASKKTDKKADKKADKKKPAKAEKKEKKPRKKSASAIVDGKISVLAKANPKRKGTNAFKKFELYKKHKSVADFLEAGGKRSSLRYDEKHGFIKVTGVTRKSDNDE